MTQPSKAGPAILFLLGVPFFGMGMMLALGFLSASPATHKGRDLLAGAAFGGAFALIGAGLMAGSIFLYRTMKQEAAAKDANPGAPWLWRTDWAEGRALSQKRSSIFAWWVGTVLAGMIVAPLAAGVLPQLVRKSDPAALMVIVFCLGPFFLLIGAVRATLRRERYGKTYFEFGSLPFSPGKRMTGQIHLRLNTSAEHGVDLRLVCMRVIITGSGKNQSRNEVILWQDQKNVPFGALSSGPLGTAIPVEFGIPADGYETNHEISNDQLEWVLFAKADVPGIDYSDAFEIPVFRAEGSAQFATTATNFAANFAPSGFAASFPASSGSAAAGTAPAFESDASEVPAPAKLKVVVNTAADGSTEFYFPAFRNRISALVLLLVASGWTAAVFFLAHSKAPQFFALIFGFIDLLLMLACMQALFGSARIIVGNGKIACERRIFGTRRRSEVPLGDVQSVLAALVMQGSSAINASYMVQLQTKAGKKFVLAYGITDRQEARWVVSQIEKLAGLKTDTHVALEGAFGRVYGPPPQRGMVGRTASSARPQQKIAVMIGFALFAAWTAFIFSKATGFRHAVTQSRKPAPASSGAQTSPPRRVFAPLTDEAIEQLRRMPIQYQAEELLERAIQHDERALELFEQEIMSPEWLGKIKLTERMKNLQQRSQYSTDLRVRYANADLNLSMEGWAKTEQSADSLIERARADPQYRSAAVYFMGMLAGRGVAYDRLHPVLVDYAKHDPDASVRVWAVEGMRYLGTDDALDELFDSFVNDPSDLVRDRAGCNISDCGNFKRVQRMRMVEKFIDLAADSNTTPIMRNWSFLALHEITDESLPNDAAIWRNWYLQHGNEVMQKFERAPWWKVRGDE